MTDVEKLSNEPQKAKPLGGAQEAWFYEGRHGLDVVVQHRCSTCHASVTLQSRVHWWRIASYVRRRLGLRSLPRGSK